MPERDAIRPVVIVGGGAAGVWAAARLAEHGLGHIVIVDPAPSAMLGRGVAYAAPDPLHTLNVPVAKMDLNPAPGYPTFKEWLAARGLEAPDGYHPRARFGDYMGDVLAKLRDRCRLDHVQARATALARAAGHFVVTLDRGPSIAARHVVLALGNLRPRPLAPGMRDPRVIEDPWQLTGDAVAGARRAVIAGTGLTAIDAVISLVAAAPEIRITLAARRPFVPPCDIGTESWPEAAKLTPKPPADLWHEVRAEIRREPGDARWIWIVEGVKNQAFRLWQAWTPAQRASFVRHGLRPWLHHRHRTPPPAHRLWCRLVDQGQATIERGRVHDVRATPAGIEMRIGRGAHRADLLINATGPSVTPEDEPLLAAGLRNGLLRRDHLGLGLAIDLSSRALGAGGAAVDGLWILGAWSRGTLFEVVPVPVIRRHAADIARRIVDSLAAPLQPARA